MRKSSGFKVQGSIFWLLILGLWILNLLLPSSSLASCINRPIIFCGNLPGTKPIECATSPDISCCDTQEDCNSALSNAGGLYNSPLCVNNNLGVNTAIGCLMAGDPKQLVSQLLGWGVGVGGGIAFLMIVLAGFQMATAGGDPKRVQAARELLMSALSGLILIVLSVVLLNFIGVKILNLPGFSL